VPIRCLKPPGRHPAGLLLGVVKRWRLSDEIPGEKQQDPCGETTVPSFGEGVEHLLSSVGVAWAKFDYARRLCIDDCHDALVVAHEVAARRLSEYCKASAHGRNALFEIDPDGHEDLQLPALRSPLATLAARVWPA